MTIAEKLIKLKVKKILYKQGYKLLRDYKGCCADCNLPIWGFVVQKEEEEEIDFNLCAECLQKLFDLENYEINKKLMELK